MSMFVPDLKGNTVVIANLYYPATRLDGPASGNLAVAPMYNYAEIVKIVNF